MSTQKNIVLEENVDLLVQSYIDYAKSNIIISELNFHSNIQDTFIDYIKSIINDPLEIIKERDRIDNQYKNIVLDFVSYVFNHYNEGIHGLFYNIKENRGLGKIFFCVVLENDNFETRDSFYQNINTLETEIFNGGIDIIVKFIPIDLIPKLEENGYKNIMNERTYSKSPT